MKKLYFLILFIIFILSCGGKDSDKVNLCKDVDCSNKANSHCNEGICVCDLGYHEDGEQCTINENNPCLNIDCSNKANSHCSEGICVCDLGYHEDGNNCITNELPLFKTFPLNGLILDKNESVDLKNTLFIMQGDGNLVLYQKEDSQPLWNTTTNGATCGLDCSYKFVFETNGNLVVFDENNNVKWHSNTANIGVNHLTIDETKLGLYDAQNHLIWSSTCDSGDLVNAPCNLYNPCDDTNCPQNSICHLNNSNQAECLCNEGYESDGNNCIEIDKCENVDCSEHSTCNSNNGRCYCDNNYHSSADGRSCIADNICETLNCSDNSSCNYNMGICTCDNGYHEDNGICVENDQNACNGCNGHGTCYIKENNDPVCACDVGYTPDDTDGLHCVLTTTVCIGGVINFDYNLDGTNETWFTPNQSECDMFELINFVRAVHDKEGSPESHKPLGYNVLFSAYGRQHSQRMTMSPISNDNPERYGEFEHGDFPPGWGGQNIAYSGDSHSHMGMYMGCRDPREPICVSSGEGHCNAMSHHCNIMRPRFSSVGVGIYDVGYEYSTQNFQ